VRITVIGSGYVGTTTALVLSYLGHNVIGLDIDPTKIKKLNTGILPFQEPGLDRLLQQELENGRISFTMDTKIAIKVSEILIIAVGTPSKPDGSADLTYLKQVLKLVAENINESKIVVTKSTVPIGTNRWMKQELSNMIHTSPYDIEVISNPEFLREGVALHDSLHPDRTVMGGDNEEAIEKIKEMYSPLQSAFFICNYETAEMIKYASNGFLATKISFINEVARLADKVGADIQAVAHGMGMDKRISPHHLYAGIGYGGSCFPKDVDALIHTGEQNEVRLQLLEDVKKINQTQTEWFINKIESYIDLRDKKLLVLGITFKEDTDDQRESAGIRLIEQLLPKGVGEIRIMDPTLTSLTQIHWSEELSESDKKKIKVQTKMENGINEIDAIIVTTPWKEFAAYPWKDWSKEVRSAYFFDGRNFFDPQKMQEYGWHYVGVARGEKKRK
jgi:UDPglucose 6-dehydrogenase